MRSAKGGEVFEEMLSMVFVCLKSAMLKIQILIGK